MNINEIGVLLSFTGASSATERSHHLAVYYALYNHSLSNSPSSLPLEIIVRDVQSSPQVCAAQVLQLAQRGIKIFTGLFTSSCPRAILPILLLGYMRGKTFAFPFRDTRTDSDQLQIYRQTRIGRVGSDRQFAIGWDTNRLLADLSSRQIVSPAEFSPNWKMLLCAWGDKSQEYVIAVSCNHNVLYANRRAAERFSLEPGTVLDENWEQHLEKNWMIEEHVVGDGTQQRLLIIRPRTTFLAQQTDSAPFPAIKTNSPLYQAELRFARIGAHSVTNLLILGETGSGKEVLARAIHTSSTRKHGPFIAVNLASLPRELIASELFGYVDGAFTGAKKGGMIGKFEAACGGTLFLDEIGEMTLDLQVILLRVLEERKATKLGDHEEKPLDVRIIAATNRNLEADVNSGRFRADLYYRLNVLQIRIPPLRDRKEDIAPLADVFLKQLRAQYGTGPVDVCEEALQALTIHPWPGNVRELRNVIERAFLLAVHEPIISLPHLPSEWNQSASCTEHSIRGIPLLREMERHTIHQAITEAHSISAAAKKLGIARSTLYRKMAELDIVHTIRSSSADG